MDKATADDQFTVHPARVTTIAKTRQGSSEKKTKTTWTAEQSPRWVVDNSIGDWCICGYEKDSRRPLGWHFGTLDESELGGG
jgi:hypothetical protein